MTENHKEGLPVIIIGQQQRCGGSLLTRLFDSHPELYVHPLDNYFGRPYKYHWPVIDISRRGEKIWEDLIEYPLKYMGKKGRMQKGEHESYRFSYDSTNHEKIFLQALEEGVKEEKEVIEAYFASLFKSYTNYIQPPNPKYYTYFTPRQCLYAEEFFNMMPKGHIVQIVRHPAAYYNSVKSHNRCYDIQTAKFLWRLFFFQALYSHLKEWRNYHVVIFEELVNEPENTLRDLCVQLGISYHENLVYPTFNRKAWGGDSNFGALKGVSKNVINHYKKFLSQDEIEYFAQEIEWYEEYIAQSSLDKGFLDQFAGLIKLFQKFLAVYKKEKPGNTAGMIFTNPDVYSKVLGQTNSIHIDYFRLMAEVEVKSFLEENEIESPEKMKEFVGFYLDASLFEKLEDSQNFANSVINFWVLQGELGIKEALNCLPDRQFGLEEVLAGIEFQVKRDIRLITVRFAEDLQKAVGGCSSGEKKRITEIRNILKQKTSIKILKNGMKFIKGLVGRV